MTSLRRPDQLAHPSGPPGHDRPPQGLHSTPPRTHRQRASAAVTNVSSFHGCPRTARRSRNADHSTPWARWGLEYQGGGGGRLHGHKGPAPTASEASAASANDEASHPRPVPRGNTKIPPDLHDRTGSQSVTHTWVRELPLPVDLRGFEPLTPSLRTRCATRLRYRPSERVKH